MKNVAINVNINNYNASPFDTINSIKKAGFTNIFINWKNYVGKDGTIITGEEQFMYAKNNNIQKDTQPGVFHLLIPLPVPVLLFPVLLLPLKLLHLA